MEKQFNFDYHHWGANKEVMEIINKREKSLEIIRLIERCEEITKHRSIRFKFNSSLNEEEMRWLQFILNYYSGKMKRFGGMEVTLSLMNRNPVLVQRIQVHQNKTRLNPNLSPAPKKVRSCNLRRTSQ